jgi:hypothetical protein
MVKIRYAELPAGLHVTAEADRLDTVVYLQPGLTTGQRRAALIRVRSSARMGQGPTLSGIAMARALAADRVRTTTRIGAAAMRRRPMLLLPVIVMVASAVVFVLMSSAPMTAASRNKFPSAVPSLRIGTRHGASTQPLKTRHGPSGRAAASRHRHTRYLRRSLSASSTLSPSALPSSPRPAPSASRPCVTLGPLGLCVQT